MIPWDPFVGCVCILLAARYMVKGGTFGAIVWGLCGTLNHILADMIISQDSAQKKKER